MEKRKSFDKSMRAMKKRKAERPSYSAMKKYSPKAFGSRDPGYVDLASASYGLDTTGTITLVATIAQGTTVNTRIGKQARYKSFQIRGSVFSGTTTTSSQGAWMLVYDKRPTGSLPAITDILVSVSEDSFLNDNNSGRFRILRRKSYTCIGKSTADTNSNPTIVHNIDEYIKCKKPITFKALGTGAIADIEMGAVYLVTVGNTANGTASVQSSITIRTRFVDV